MALRTTPNDEKWGRILPGCRLVMREQDISVLLEMTGRGWKCHSKRHLFASFRANAGNLVSGLGRLFSSRQQSID